MAETAKKANARYQATEEETLKFSKSVGENIKSWREVFHLSQEQLGRVVGVSVFTIQKWEQGKIMPKPENLIALGKAFEIEPAELLRIVPAHKEIKRRGR